MPMLPSGRHVAIRLNPLHQLIEDASNAFNVHKVLSIKTAPDLHPFTEVLWLIPEQDASQEQKGVAFLDGSLPCPPGLIAVPSGFRLAQLEEFARDWDEADRFAFWNFIHIRAQPIFEDALAMAQRAQEILRKHAEGITELMVLWWDAGVHPAQDGSTVEEWETPEWDAYDMLAALGKMRTQLRQCNLDDKLRDDLIRLNALWSIYSDHVPELKHWPHIDTSLRAEAESARQAKWLDTFSEDERKTMRKQCVHECVELWNHIGARLQSDFPEQEKIIDLVVVSAEKKYLPLSDTFKNSPNSG